MSDVAVREPACDDALATTRYEELRRHVLGQTLEPTAMMTGTGLAVLKRSGLRAWLEASRDHEPIRPFARSAPPMGDAHRSHADQNLNVELARVVTSMVLSQFRQEQRI